MGRLWEECRVLVFVITSLHCLNWLSDNPSVVRPTQPVLDVMRRTYWEIFMHWYRKTEGIIKFRSEHPNTFSDRSDVAKQIMNSNFSNLWFIFISRCHLLTKKPQQKWFPFQWSHFSCHLGRAVPDTLKKKRYLPLENSPFCLKYWAKLKPLFEQNVYTFCLNNQAKGLNLLIK